MTMEWKNSTALVTGASSGIGAEFAAQEAAMASIWCWWRAGLTGSRPCAAGCSSGTRRCVSTSCLRTWLPSARRRNWPPISDEAGQHIDVLVNNAGVGFHRPFADEPAEEVAAEIHLNCGALVDLTARFLPGMRKARRGVVINLASTSAFQPVPTMAVYAATKAFVLSFTEALWWESRGSGVRVIALCPGATQTEFFDRSSAAFMTRGRQSAAQASKSAMKVATSDRQGLPAQRMPGQMNSWRGSARTTTCAWNKAANRQWRLRPRQALAPPARHRRGVIPRLLPVRATAQRASGEHHPLFRPGVR